MVRGAAMARSGYRPYADRILSGDTGEGKRQQELVRCFSGCEPSPDLGCGCGLFLRLLLEQGIHAVGVDLVVDEPSPYPEGLSIHRDDALDCVKQCRETYDRLSCSQFSVRPHHPCLIEAILEHYRFELSYSNCLSREALGGPRPAEGPGRMGLLGKLRHTQRRKLGILQLKDDQVSRGTDSSKTARAMLYSRQESIRRRTERPMAAQRYCARRAHA